MTTIHDALSDAKQRFAPISTSASLDAQLLLAEILGVNRAYLIAHSEKTLTPEQTAHYESWVTRRVGGEPIAYILGRQAFYDRDFIATPAVLIPRPETEHLLELALDFAREHPLATVVDVGTGSGALAVTLAAHAPQATVYATDISPDALTVARQNAEKYSASITFLCGDLLTPLVERQIRVDLIMANLPYIPTAELNRLAVSQYEPRLALDGGTDGLVVIRRLLGQAATIIRPAGMILLEIGADQGQAVVHLAQTILQSAQVEIYQDYARLDRVVQMQLPLDADIGGIP